VPKAIIVAFQRHWMIACMSCPECGQQSAFRISRPDLKLHPVFRDAGTIPPYGQLADAG
jgi:hypothetical protein